VSGVKKPVVNWVARGQGDTVLVINGWSASGLAWPKAWLAELESRYRVVRFDNRGSGWSRAAPQPFTMGDLADDARDVLVAGGGGPARVLGLSMGGMIAQELAIRHSGLVSQLVLAGTRPPAPAATLSNPLLLADVMRPPVKGQALADYVRHMWSRFAAPGFAEANPQLMNELVEQIVRRPTPRAGVFAQIRAMSSWHGARRLATIDVPTTVIHGSEDPLIPVANGRVIAELIPGARFEELAGVGHLLPHEAPESLTKAIDSDW
jgi:3-oxoadipate enol-lactonase